MSGVQGHSPWPSSDLAACRALLRQSSRSFFAASLLLPARIRAPASALYAFCRLADDAIDLDEGGGRLATLARLRDRLDRAYAGRPLPLAADRAFAATVARFAIPRALPEALLEGLEWDARGRTHETLADLEDYAARVAGSVGAMMAVVMGVRGQEALARACDLGVAMQLSNIARDVGEDASAGRLYLPRAWLREAGIDPDDWLADPRPGPALAAVIARLLAVAETLYARAAAGLPHLPRDCRPGIEAARLLYGEIGREVARRGLDPLAGRAVVPGRRRAALLARAAAAIAAPAAARNPSPPLAATRFLVDAVAAAPRPASPGRVRAIEAQALWVLDLFARLEQRARLDQPRGVGL